jgi:hypothetical protein
MRCGSLLGIQIRTEWYDGECAEAAKVKNNAYQKLGIRAG